MRALLTHAPGGRRLLIAFVICTLGPIEAAWAVTQKQVLVLYSTRRDAQVSILGDRELPRMLEQGLGESLDFYSEYIDLGRFADPGYQTAFSEFLRLKYQGQRFDLLIAIQDVAVRFAAQRRDELFPGTPLVFVATPAPAPRIANSTGLVIGLDLTGSLALAAELQPTLRHVFVVSGADTRDRIYEHLARAQFRAFEPRFGITYLAGLSTADLEARLARLPEHSAIYYLLVNRDGGGVSFHPLDYLERIAAVANAPIYSWVDSTMDHGIVGGSLKNLAAQTDAVGQLAVRVLRGERADSIPVLSSNLNVRQVDWRQLQRWGISDLKVPAGTLIRFKEPSVWDRYRVYILAAMALLLGETALIAGLLVQRTRRRHAEEHARESQTELRTSYERIRDLGARLLNAQETERSRIARELHDDISQQVALLTVDLELLGSPRQAQSDMLVREALSRAHEIAKSVHDLSHRLHPAKLRLIGLVPALHALQRELSQPDTSVAFTHANVSPNLRPDLTVCLFRIVQEALQNAIKYSQARRVSVHLASDAEGLSLTIADDGVGFDVDAAWGKGLGLISMVERLEAIGGALAVHSRPGGGTRVEVKVPLSVIQAPETVPV
jgi:signal transduction histidine kinase